MDEQPGRRHLRRHGEPALGQTVSSEFSGWVGATVAFAHASSPAQFINNIGAYGDVPGVSWRYSTTSLGLGGAVGYDITKNEYGGIAVMLALDSEGIERFLSATTQG